MNAKAFAASIVDEAKKKAAAAEKAASARVQEIKKETAELVAKRESELLEEAKRSAAKRKQQLEAAERKRVRMEDLECRHELVDKAFAEAEARLMKLKDRDAVLENLWKRAQDSMDVDSVTAAEQDAGFFKKKTTVSGVTGSTGGFIAHSKNKKLKMDFTFEAILSRVKERQTPEIAHILFGEESNG